MFQRPMKIDLKRDSGFFELIDMLKKGSSGEEIAKKLGVSRNAIWKKIRKIKESGYEIEARRKVGYRIKKFPEFSALQVAEIIKKTGAESLINRIYYYIETDSTNERAKELDPGSIVIAERQISGRGRLGREWVSDEGGLYFSIVLSPGLGVEDIPKITLSTGVAVTEALSKYNARLKWPNDVLIGGKKVCGVLCELAGEIDNFKVIVGIGINVRNTPPASLNAISLVSHDNSITRLKVFEDVMREFKKYYAMLESGDWEKIRRRWMELSDTIGRHVRISVGEKVFEGRATDLDVDGGLIIDSGHVQKVFSGECFYIS